MAKRGRMLIDTGAGVNLVKDEFCTEKFKLRQPHTIKLGNDKHVLNYYTIFKVHREKHIFYIIPNDFPLIEDGIIGLTFLKKHDYAITNDKLRIDKDIINLQETIEEIPTKSHRTVYTKIGNEHTRVCFINNGKEDVKLTNQISFEKRVRIGKLFAKLKFNTPDPQHVKTIKKLIYLCNDVFSLDTDPLPCTNITTHTIEPKNSKPINIKSYRPPECHRIEIKNQIQDMLNKKIIEPSDSPYNAPIWVVPKKLDASGKQKWRVVVDFRKLNETTEQDAYPLPNQDDILAHLGDAKFFSALDLSSGFHQIPMSIDSKKYTAFSTTDGHYHFNRMPFGLKNAPATFQRMMDTALRGLIGKNCFVYLDDIIIFGKTLEEHNDNLSKLFKRLRDTGLKLQADKCEFLKPELEYLGHLITASGIKPNPAKLSAIKNFKIPKNVTQVKSFLGLSGYYRKFIKNFSTISKPLTELTKKGTKFDWDMNRQNSFDLLKEKLCSPPILSYPNFNKTFILTTDASNDGIGGVLSQDGHPCCFISRTLNSAEQNYTTTEKELLAIVWSVKRLRQYLLGRKFIIETDH